MSCDEITGCVKEDSGFAVMARVQVDGTNWTQAGVSAITWKAWDINDRSAAYTSGTLVVGTVVYNSLQTDARWTLDATGYNFRHDIGSGVFVDPGRYRIEYAATLTGGTQLLLGPFVVNVENMWTDGE